jgi:hypothetical protein
MRSLLAIVFFVPYTQSMGNNSTQLDIEGTISYLLGGDDRLVRFNIPE